MSERYEIKAKLGEGGAGSVYRAWDSMLNRTVAIKRLIGNVSADEAEKMRKDLMREASLLSSIQHPNICQVYDFGVDEDGGYVAMEFVNGEDLEEAARRQIQPGEFAGIAAQTLEGVAAAHAKSILHRDLKPSNVMINWLPNAQFAVKVLDFGLAKFSLKPTQQTIDQATRTTKGSIFFMAPEQFEHRPLDVRTDLYSVGCLFYFLLTGKHPFQGATMADIMQHHLDHRIAVPLEVARPDLPPTLVQWVGWLMNRNAEDRPPHAAEALRVLNALRGQWVGGDATPGVAVPEARTVPSAPVNPMVATQQKPVIPLAVTGAAPLRPETTGRVPALTQRTVTGQTPTQPTPKTGARPLARTGTVGTRPRRGATGAAPLSRKPSRSKIPSWAWAAGGAAAIAGVLFLFTGGGGKKPPEATPAPSAKASRAAADSPGNGPPSAEPKGILENGLVIWLDGRSLAGDSDGFITRWQDRAPLGGNNVASTSTTEKAPKVLMCSDGGFRSPHLVMHCEGRQRLTVGHEPPAPGDPLGEIIDPSRNSMTAFVVARIASEKDREYQRIFSAKMGDIRHAWSMSWQDGHLQSGFRAEDDRRSQTPRVRSRSGTFFVATARWNTAANAYDFSVTESDGTTRKTNSVPGLPVNPPVDQIRLGVSTLRDQEYLTGDIAEFLVYNRLLSDAEVKAVEDELVRKYFR